MTDKQIMNKIKRTIKNYVGKPCRMPEDELHYYSQCIFNGISTPNPDIITSATNSFCQRYINKSKYNKKIGYNKVRKIDTTLENLVKIL